MQVGQQLNVSFMSRVAKVEDVGDKLVFLLETKYMNDDNPLTTRVEIEKEHLELLGPDLPEIMAAFVESDVAALISKALRSNERMARANAEQAPIDVG